MVDLWEFFSLRLVGDFTSDLGEIGEGLGSTFFLTFLLRTDRLLRRLFRIFGLLRRAIGFERNSSTSLNGPFTTTYVSSFEIDFLFLHRQFGGHFGVDSLLLISLSVVRTFSFIYAERRFRRLVRQSRTTSLAGLVRGVVRYREDHTRLLLGLFYLFFVRVNLYFFG